VDPTVGLPLTQILKWMDQTTVMPRLPMPFYILHRLIYVHSTVHIQPDHQTTPSISTVDPRSPNQRLTIILGGPLARILPARKKAVFSLLQCVTCRLVYGIGGNPSNTTYHPKPARNTICHGTQKVRCFIHKYVGPAA